MLLATLVIHMLCTTQLQVGRASKALAGLEPTGAVGAGGDYLYDDQATTAAIDAAASAVRHEAGSAAFLQQRYLESLDWQVWSATLRMFQLLNWVPFTGCPTD